jgi:hypothetical protein
VQFAELFSAHAAALLHYARQVEQLGEAIHTRTDIGTAVGILMVRFGIDKDRAFGFLVRNSSHRNIKTRELAKTVIDGTFERTSSEDTSPRNGLSPMPRATPSPQNGGCLSQGEGGIATSLIPAGGLTTRLSLRENPPRHPLSRGTDRVP